MGSLYITRSVLLGPHPCRVIDAVARGASANKLLSHDFTLVTYYEHACTLYDKNVMAYKAHPILECADQTHHYTTVVII